MPNKRLACRRCAPKTCLTMIIRLYSDRRDSVRYETPFSAFQHTFTSSTSSRQIPDGSRHPSGVNGVNARQNLQAGKPRNRRPRGAERGAPVRYDSHDVTGWG